MHVGAVRIRNMYPSHSFSNSFLPLGISLCLLTLLACCTPERIALRVEQEERAAITDSTVIIDIGQCTVDRMPLSRLVRKVDYVELETNDSSILYTPTHIMLTDSLIYVYDVMEQLKKFDRTGRYLGDAYRRGGGPEELADLYDFDVDEDYLYLLEGARSILFKFTHQGELAERQPLPFRAIRFKRLCNGEFLFRLAPFVLLENTDEHVLLVHTDKDFHVIGRHFEQDHAQEGTVLRTPFFENARQSCYFAPLFRRSIYEWGRQGLQMKYYLEFGTPYYEPTKKVDGQQEAKEQGLFYTYQNPIHNDAYIFQPFVISTRQQGLLIIDRASHKAAFVRHIEMDRPDVLDFNILSSAMPYDERTASFVGLASYYYEESFKPDDLRLIKEALPDSVEPILLRKEKEEVNPVLMSFQPGDRLVP